MMALTGVTGHLGNVLLKELHSRREKIRALVLPDEETSLLKELDVEWVKGDVRDPKVVEQLCKGARQVFHMASMISITKGKEKLIHDVNVGGTNNVIRACFKQKVKRLIYTSSVHAFSPILDSEVLDEQGVINPPTVLGYYGKTKAMATLAVMDAIKQGLDAVIVHPAAIVGPPDYRPSKLGQTILMAARGKLPVNLQGAYCFVDVRDVVQGELLAAEKGIKGHNYILSGERRTLGDFFQMVTHALGKKVLQIPIPQWLARIPAHIADLYYSLSKKEPLFTSEALAILRTNTYMTAKRARQELGFSPRPLQDTLEDELAWFQAEGVL